MTPKQEIERQAIFGIAYHDFQKKLNTHAFFKVNDHAIGEDLVQDTFMKTWSYLVRGGKIDVMKSFLYHVLNGCIVDQYRKHKTTSLDNLVDNGFEPKETDSEDIVNILDSKRAALMINLLPIKYRQLMQMKYLQNLSLGEMSKATGQSKNTVAVQIHRGFEKLRVLYKPAMAVGM
jgi:RNA polymerase sigma-70 factor (ECF subfamily)